MDLKNYIGEIPDFPKEGILFYDINPLLANPKAFNFLIDSFKQAVEDLKPDIILGIESRGFLFAPSLAKELGLPFGLIRKPGKLPGSVISKSYEKEYGEDTLEIQAGLLDIGIKVLIVDDLLATGGTMQAAIELVKKAGADPVGSLYAIELEALNGHSKMPVPQISILKY